MQRTMAGLVAIFVATPLLSCAMNLKWDSDTADKPPPPQAASQAPSQDDSACQSAGYAYGTPEYQQCMQNIAQQRVNQDRAEHRPYYGLQR
jgi:hypothetical protein